jgi:thiamine transport system permease protein
LAVHNGGVLLAVGLLPLIFVGVFIFYPQAALYLNWVGLEDLTRVATMPMTRVVLTNSLLQASASAILSVLVGYPAGVILARYDVPHKRALKAAIIVPFMLPTIVVATAFLSLYGEAGALGSFLRPLNALAEGFTGIVAVNVFYNSPLVAYLVAASVERMDPELVDAARLFGGGRLQPFLRLLLPQTYSGVASGFLITFLYSFIAFAVPLVIGGPANSTVEVQVYSLFKSFMDFRGAAALALLQLSALAALTFLYFSRVVERAQEVPVGAGVASVLVALSLKKRPFTTILVLSYLAAFCFYLFAPLAGVVRGALWAEGGPSLQGLLGLFSSRVQDRLGISVWGMAFNTVFFASMTAMISLALGLMAAYFSLRVLKRGRLYETALFASMMVSPVTLSLSLFVSLEWIHPFDLVWPLILAAHVSVALPLTVRFLSSSLSKVPRELMDAASVSGSGKADSLFRLQLPLTWTGFVAAGAFAFATSLGEFAATNFLYVQELTTMTVGVYQLLGSRMMPQAYSLSALLIAMSFAAYLVAFRFQEELTLG